MTIVSRLIAVSAKKRLMLLTGYLTLESYQLLSGVGEGFLGGPEIQALEEASFFL